MSIQHHVNIDGYMKAVHQLDTKLRDLLEWTKKYEKSTSNENYNKLVSFIETGELKKGVNIQHDEFDFLQHAKKISPYQDPTLVLNTIQFNVSTYIGQAFIIRLINTLHSIIYVDPQNGTSAKISDPVTLQRTLELSPTIQNVFTQASVQKIKMLDHPFIIKQLDVIRDEVLAVTQEHITDLADANNQACIERNITLTTLLLEAQKDIATYIKEAKRSTTAISAYVQDKARYIQNIVNFGQNANEQTIPFDTLCTLLYRDLHYDNQAHVDHLIKIGKIGGY